MDYYSAPPGFGQNMGGSGYPGYHPAPPQYPPPPSSAAGADIDQKSRKWAQMNSKRYSKKKKGGFVDGKWRVFPSLRRKK